MQWTTRKKIEALLDNICRVHGIARSKEYGQCGLDIDRNSAYGGYTLEAVTKDGTVGSSPARMSAGNFYTALRIAQFILEAKERFGG